MPLPLLAAGVQPLADRGWTAYQVDRATETYGPVTSGSGLRRVLQAVAAYVAGDQRRRDVQVSQLAIRIADAQLAAEAGPAVWSDTSSAARTAYAIAADARAKSEQQKTRAPGWQRLLEITEPDTAASVDRSAQILARARRRAAQDRRRQA